jgi:phosphoribosylamine---glycine ligase
VRVLVVGGGGREHALVWALRRSPLVHDVICAPGNPGIATIAECYPVAATDVAGQTELAVNSGADLVVVGPEAPLAAGLADALAEKGIAVFGPGASGARLEASKSFAKQLMARAGIATATSRAFERADEAIRYVNQLGGPAVVKADGLAAGKGVTVCEGPAQAQAAILEAMQQGRFGEAGRRVLIEERMEGQELSILALTDGKSVLAMPAAQDFKRAYDGDLGPNTGGMGSYSPVPICTRGLFDQAVGEVLEPAVAALAEMGVPYVGVVYAGLMATPEGLKVVEFNCRFGDPETQAILPRLTSDLAEAMTACTEGSLAGTSLDCTGRACVSVVAASAGYPEQDPLVTGLPIEGVSDAAQSEDVLFFHAGTAIKKGRLVTSGGRVLSVSALGDGIAEARARAYRALQGISFEGMRYRGDIAAKAAVQNS